MDETFYSEQEIEELWTKYKWYRRIYQWGGLIFIIIATNFLYFPRGWFDTYGYYDKAGSFRYISNISNFTTAIFYIVVILVCCVFRDAIFKKVLKGKYTEFEIGRTHRNIKKRKYARIVNILLAVFLIIASLFFLVRKFRQLTYITLSENDFQIKYRYGKDIDGIFNYDYFDEMEISMHKRSATMYLTNNDSEDQYLFIEIGRRTKYQDELLKILDEKTNNKFELLKNAAEADGL